MTKIITTKNIKEVQLNFLQYTFNLSNHYSRKGLAVNASMYVVYICSTYAHLSGLSMP